MYIILELCSLSAEHVNSTFSYPFGKWLIVQIAMAFLARDFKCSAPTALTALSYVTRPTSRVLYQVYTEMIF